MLLASRLGLAEGQEPRGPVPEDTTANVGVHGGLPYLRAFDDRVRLYPEAAVRLDATWAPKPDHLAPALGGDAAGARFVLRRLRLGMSGEIFRHVAFTAEVEMGGQRIGETLYAGPLTRRWAPADAHDGVLRPAEVSVSAMPWRALSFTVGQVAAPFSLANRTPEAAVTFNERPLAIRGFAVPNERALGAMAWGEVAERAFAYEVGVFSSGTGQPVLSGNVDVMGRAFVRPFTRLGRGVFFELAQIGVSARMGFRDPSRDMGDVATLATGQGFVLWQPGYVDSLGRVTRVLPSGAQRAIGGELRLPVRTPTQAVFDLRAEAYLVRNDTREAVRGFEPTNTERLGRLSGASWYVSLDWWACFIPGFEQLVTGEPGMSRPKSLDDHRMSAPKSAFEASIIAGGIHASYDGATRWGSTENSAAPARAITVYQFGGAVQYLLGTNVRAALDYMAYVAPNSGDATVTTLLVPQNLPRTSGGPQRGHVAHELGLRIGAGF
jgi:hypothetical protein